MDKGKEIHDGTNSQIRALLNADQQKKFDEMQEWTKNMGPRRGPDHPQSHLQIENCRLQIEDSSIAFLFATAGCELGSSICNPGSSLRDSPASPILSTHGGRSSSHLGTDASIRQRRLSNLYPS